MPRPLRIEYPNAFYHVMNRGKGRQMIFLDEKYYLDFLKTISEAHERFGAIIHCYCLMGNHYHLLIETPEANISRVMRHINGIYTQRYNRLSSTDGPLFRGRFKAILVDSEAYLLQLNRYIHKNPIIFDMPLEEYRWSSYMDYLNLRKPPKWLNKNKTLSLIGSISKYKKFIEGDVDEYLVKFYKKPKLERILGSDHFKEKILSEVQIYGRKREVEKINKERLSINQVIETTAKVFNVTICSIQNKQQGKRIKNFPRKFAMFLCQEHCGYKLIEIGRAFNIEDINTLSNVIYTARKEIKLGHYQEQYQEIKRISMW